MSTGMSQKEYLKKYLSGSKKDETKKKKKKKKVIGQGMKIIDDDLDLSRMKPLEDSELDILYAEDAPVIVGIIDDEEEERRRKAHFTSNTWRVINHDDGFNSSIKVEQIRRKIKIGDLGGESPKSDSDLSPPRENKGDDSDLSPVRTKKNNNKSGYDSDLSPPRQQKRTSDRDTKRLQNKSKKQDSDSDLSPPRKKVNKDVDSDLSPPRRRDKYKDESKAHHRDRNDGRERGRDQNRERGNRKSRWDADEDRREGRDDKKMSKTLEGKRAGLQNARQLKDENDEIKKKEDELFGKLSEDLTGRNAATIKRNLKNRDRNSEADKAAEKDREERQKILDEKYSKWGRGLKQTEEQESRVKDYLHEASKPLARYKDDKDLDQQLRERERMEDPMLEYIQKKKKENEGEESGESYPLYKGAYPPNRFNIRPGHRWDGVDRSSGYEKSYFNMKNSKIAQEEEIYKWSTEDM